MIDPTFETARLWLRPVGREDLNALVDLDSDPEVMRHINGGQPQSRAVYEGGLLDRMLVHRGQRFGYFSALAGGADGSFVGWFHLRPSVFDGSILELGYRLRRSRWGCGLATEGSRALLRYGFEVLGIPAIDACALPENTASIAVMRKLGMREIGMARHPRVDAELVRYMITRDAHQARGESARGPRS